MLVLKFYYKYVYQGYYIYLKIYVSCAGALLSPEVDMALLQRLRGLVDRLKDQLRQRDRELQSKQTEVDSVSY